MAPSYEFAFAADNFAAVLIPALVSGIPSGLFRIAAYVLTALALYTLAKRRCIDHAWLAWVPVANVWLLGSLSDQYRYVVKGRIRSQRKVLLTLKIVSAALVATIVSLLVAVVVQGVRGTMYGIRGDVVFESQMGIVLAMLGAALPLAVISIVYTVLRFIALHDVYTSCDPDNNVLFTVLSILFSFTEPFFLFFSRNKDRGMPPRRETAAPPPQWEAPRQDSWENKDYL